MQCREASNQPLCFPVSRTAFFFKHGKNLYASGLALSTSIQNRNFSCKPVIIREYRVASEAITNYTAALQSTNPLICIISIDYHRTSATCSSSRDPELLISRLISSKARVPFEPLGDSTSRNPEQPIIGLFPIRSKAKLAISCDEQRQRANSLHHFCLVIFPVK